MRLLSLLERTIRGYHGSSNASPQFSASHTGENSSTFGAYHSFRTGIFFSNNAKFAAMYGTVGEYTLTLRKTINVDNRDVAFKFAQTLDAHDPDQRPIWIDAMSVSREQWSVWQLFEEDLGEAFVPWLIQQGYDSASFTEYNEDDDGKERRSKTTVVFDPSMVSKVK